MEKSTKAKPICDFISEIKQLKPNILPTNDSSIFRFYFYIFISLKKQSKKDPSDRYIISEVTYEV